MKKLKKCACIIITLSLLQGISMTCGMVSAANTPIATVSVSTASVKKLPSSVTLNKTSENLVVGATITLKATVSPVVTSMLTWTSSNKKVVTVDANGKVKAVGKGTANVTVSTSNGKTAVCVVSVITQNEAYVAEVARLVNEERTKRGLNKLLINSKLAGVAQKRALETSQRLSHTRPNGKSFSTVLDEYGIKYTVAGENIAYNYYTAEEAMEGLMDSKGHKDNILNSRFKYIGVGLYEEDGINYLVQIFT